MDRERMSSFARQIEEEWKENILPFWIEYAQDKEKGGFYGYLHNNRRVEQNHGKASVLNFRILWTFSAAYRISREEKYLEVARRAYEYIREYFIDRVYSGVFWMLDSRGKPTDTKKQVYSVAFAIYGLSEYHRATGNPEALAMAVELFESLERNARDLKYKGYLEALTRDWAPLADMSLSPSDMNVAKSMNTHLHILEAYTNLLRAWDSPVLRCSLKEVLEVILEHIVDSRTWSFNLFFDQDWTSRADIVSYGHNIEGSWLICEAAGVIGEEALLERAEAVSLKMAGQVFREGIDRMCGGIYNDRQDGRLDDSKDWWPQAEAVVGFLNAYQLSGNEEYLEASLQTWEFIRKYITDKTFGEWIWGVTQDGRPTGKDEKVGPWKCPYHNGRMCFEITERIANFNIGRRQSDEQIL